METINIINAIDDKIKQLDNIKRSVKNVGDLRATKIAEYDKAIALTIMKLKSGEPAEIDGFKCDNIAVTIMEKVAKGMCWKEHLEAEKAEGRFRAIMSHLETTRNQLNALQSILRYTEEV